MRSPTQFLLATILLFAAMPAVAGDISLTLNLAIGSGTPANLPPDADNCALPSCVLFTGAISDADTDGTFAFLTGISVSFTNTPAAGQLELDNTFYNDVPGVLSGDPNYLTDGSFPNAYNGPIFGIDVEPGTSYGIYHGLATLDVVGGDGDPNSAGFVIVEPFTVVVAPEPGPAGLLLAALLPLAVCYRVRRQWHSSAPPR